MLNDIKNNAQTRMAKSIDALKHTLTSIRTGRCHPALLDRVTVSAYGNASTPLNQVASISNADAHSLLVTPFDKGMIKEIEKGLYNAEFTPNTLGTAIRINMPPPTEERRKELVKQVQKEGKAPRSRSATSVRTRTRKSPSWSRTKRSAKTRRSAAKTTSRS